MERTNLLAEFSGPARTLSLGKPGIKPPQILTGNKEENNHKRRNGKRNNANKNIFHYFTDNLPYIHLKNDAKDDYASEKITREIRNRYHSILLFLLQRYETKIDFPNLVSKYR